ncbi:MAG: helix-turn-helix transcriptional regulator [Selenomonadaceae bacterium]|nr:helix-turn-helix transcriptional regulator [Selenomonadaceae bacterium]
MDEKLLQDIGRFLKTYYLSPVKIVKERSNIKFSASISSGDEDGIVKIVNLDLPTDDIPKDSEAWNQQPIDKKPSGRIIDKIKYAIDKIFTDKEDTFAERLFRHIKVKGLTDTEIYKKAGIDRRLFSKIRSNKDYQPSKDTAILLVLALELSYDDALDLLHRAGFTLSMSRRGDVVITYFLYNEIHDILLINEVLFQYGFPILGERAKN